MISLYMDFTSALGDSVWLRWPVYHTMTECQYFGELISDLLIQTGAKDMIWYCGVS